MTDRIVRLLVIGSVIAVFLGGLVTGYVLGTHRAGEPPPREDRLGPPGPGPRQLDALLDRFTAEVGVSADQRAAIATVMRDGQRGLRETMERLRPELEARRTAIEGAIDQILTPDQRARYHAMMPDGLPRPPLGPPGPPGSPPPR
jgi:hypothetical protein